MEIPQHVAIILDGNGRWAKSKGMPRSYGHIQGAKNMEVVCQAADDFGIKYLTVYAFSTENWSRPTDEVAALMSLLKNYLSTCYRTAKKHNMRIRVIGDRSGLDEAFQKKILEVEKKTESFDGLQFTVALNYGSRDEITRCMKNIASDVEKGIISADDINEEYIGSRLDTSELPYPDLMIRTSGEQRLSNFLMWQLAYAEFYFTPVPWPDFGRDELWHALESYADRDRRYGKV